MNALLLSGIGGASLLGGFLQQGLYRLQGDIAADTTLLQGASDAFAYRMDASAARRDKDNVHAETLDALMAFDLEAGALVADIEFEYAKAGIPISGSAKNNIQSNNSQVALQKSLIAKAGSNEQYKLMLSAINYDYLAKTSENNAQYTARLQRLGGRLQGSTALTGSIFSAATSIIPFVYKVDTNASN